MRGWPCFAVSGIKHFHVVAFQRNLETLECFSLWFLCCCPALRLKVGKKCLDISTHIVEVYCNRFLNSTGTELTKMESANVFFYSSVHYKRYLLFYCSGWKTWLMSQSTSQFNRSCVFDRQNKVWQVSPSKIVTSSFSQWLGLCARRFPGSERK